MRKEIKFEINREEYDNINKSLSRFVSNNQTIMKKEQYNVKTIYFDNIYNLCLNENINGQIYREKYRIRMYNNNPMDVFLEKKIKKENYIFKYREKISKNDVEKICEEKIDDFIKQTNLKQDFYINVKTKLLLPKIIIEYDRVAFEHYLTNARITLDTNLCKNEDIDDFFEESKNISNMQKYILEVKYEDIIPKYIFDIMKINIQRQRLSKYVTMRLNK